MDLGKTTRRLRRFGSDNRIESFPQRHEEVYRDFSKGYVVDTNRESIDPGASPFCINVEITKRNRLRSSGGSTLVESFGERNPNYLALHASLDFTAELLFFDAPFLGVKRTGSTVWLDVGLASGPFAYANYGGTLVFTDGERVFGREPNDAHNLEVLTEAPVARAYASWAGRLWAGATLVDGRFEPLGIAWSAVAEENTEGIVVRSDHRDWNGEGAGAELLIDDMTAGDRIVALRPIGLDFMAVMMRNSIWVGSRTGDIDRPGDFKSRIPGLGAVTEPVCRMTPRGIMFLSDSGVYSFDGNTPQHLSRAIDGILLPLDYENLDAYWATYDPQKQWYYLHTPCETFIFDLLNNRWLPLSLLAEASVVWPIQLPFIRWMDLIGDWSNQAQYRWLDYRGTAEGLIEMLFMGDLPDGERAIERRDPRSRTFFGEQFESIWEWRPVSDKHVNRLITMKEFLVEYVGFGRLTFWAPNIHGVYEPFAQGDLPNISNPDIAIFAASKTGRILGLQVRFCEPFLEILQAETKGQLRSNRIEQIDGPHYPAPEIPDSDA